MPTGLTPTAVVNMALIQLGDQPITALDTDDNDRALAARTLYATERDAMTAEHPWNHAIARVVLVPYTEPATTLTPGATTGTGVTFTAGAAGTFFIAGVSDVGKELEGTAAAGEATIATHPSTSPAQTLTPAAGALVEGTTGVVFTAGGSVFVAGDIGKVITYDLGNGIATITAQAGTTATCTINEAFPSTSAIASGDWTLTSTSTVTADITETFASTSAIASGDWRLNNVAPAFEYSYQFALPTDFLRFWREHDRNTYQREGGVLLSDASSLSIRYIRQVVDPDEWTPLFLQAFIHRLAWKLSMALTGKAQHTQLQFQLYSETLKKAKGYDGQEGTPELLYADELIAVRHGGSGHDASRTGWWR